MKYKDAQIAALKTENDAQIASLRSEKDAQIKDLEARLVAQQVMQSEALTDMAESFSARVAMLEHQMKVSEQTAALGK